MNKTHGEWIRSVSHRENFLKFRLVAYFFFTVFMVVHYPFFPGNVNYIPGMAALAIAAVLTILYKMQEWNGSSSVFNALLLVEIINCGIIYHSLNYRFNPAVICFMPVFLFSAHRGETANYYLKSLAVFAVFFLDIILLYLLKQEYFLIKASLINFVVIVMIFAACAAIMHESNREERMIRDQYNANLATRRRLRDMNDELADRLKDINEKLSMTFMNIITALVKMLESRDPCTMGHSDRVTKYALKLAAAVNVDHGGRMAIRYGGTFHDIGKVAIPDRILLKPRALTGDEFLVMKSHVTIGRKILTSITGMNGRIIDICHYHHERVDGRGYPLGLAGTAIPLEARIMGIADSFEAMTSDRCYRPAMPVECALEELHRHAGTQLDRDLTQVFIDLVEEGEISA